MFIQGSPAALHPVNLRGLGAVNYVPGVSRADLDMVLRAYADNVRAQIMPDDAAINYWMQVGLDNFDATVEAVRKTDPSLAAQIDAERLAAVTEYFGGLTGDPDEDLNRLQLAAMMKQNELKASLVMSQVAPDPNKNYIYIESGPDQLVPIAVGPVPAPIAPPPVYYEPVVPDVPTPIELTPEQECEIYCEWSAAKSRALVGGEYVTMEAFPRPQNCTCPDEIIKTPVVTDNVVIKDSRTVPAESTITPRTPTTPAPAMPTGAIFAAIAAYLLLG